MKRVNCPMHRFTEKKSLYFVVLILFLIVFAGFPVSKLQAMYQEPPQVTAGNPGKQNKSDRSTEAAKNNPCSSEIVEIDEDTDQAGFANALSDRSKLKLGQALREEEQSLSIRRTVDNNGSIDIINAYIMASPTQRNTAMGWLSTLLPKEKWDRLNIRQLPIIAEDQLHISPVTGLYRFSTHNEKKYLPHLTVQALAILLLTGMHATTSSLLPDGLVDGSSAEICDSSLRGHCINALLSLISKLEPDKLLRNVTSLEQAYSLSHESFVKLLSNGSLALENIVTESINFTEGNFFGETHATGILTKMEPAYENIALFAALVFGINYGPPLIRTTLLPLFVKAGDGFKLLYKRILSRYENLPGSHKLLLSELQKHPDMTDYSKKLITQTENSHINMVSFLSGIKQSDTRLFIEGWSELDEQQHQENSRIMKQILTSPNTALHPETFSHGHLIQDVSDLVNQRGDRANLINNIAANLSSIVITGLIIYGITEWINQIVSMNPMAVLADVNFPDSCQSWGLIQREFHGENCSLIDGKIEHIELSSHQQIAFSLVITAMSLLSSDIRSLLRGSFRITHKAAMSLFRVALLLITCITPGEEEETITVCEENPSQAQNELAMELQELKISDE